jgi:hypothetical protein
MNSPFLQFPPRRLFSLVFFKLCTFLAKQNIWMEKLKVDGHSWLECQHLLNSLQIIEVHKKRNISRRCEDMNFILSW